MDPTVTSTRRAPGVLLLLGLVGLGMGVPAFFRWQYFAAEANRDRILEEAPTEPEARLELFFKTMRNHLDQALDRARFSAEFPWIVSHVVAPVDEGEPPQVWGIHAEDDVAYDAIQLDGLEIRVLLPAPRLLGREVLVGDNALGVAVYASPGPEDPRVLLRDRVEFVLEPVIEGVSKDVPGTRLSVEIDGLRRPWGTGGGLEDAGSTSPEGD